MRNVEMTRQGDKLHITVDLSQRLGLSQSGKTTLVASTEGIARVEGADGMAISMSVFTKERAPA